MKKQLLKMALLAVTLSAGLALQPAFAARCDPSSDCPPGECGPRGDKSEHRIDRMAEVLDLSAAQQEAIEAIRTEERARTAPLREEMAGRREAMEAAIKAQPFDEEAVRTLAAAQAATRTELTVARARMQSRIHAVLTPGQRTLAEKLRSLRKGERGPRGRHGAPEEGDL